MIGWIIFTVVATCVLLYCKYGKSVGHVPDFRKPFSIVALIVYTIIMLVCCSCRTQYIPVETVRTEIQYKERKDSSVIKEVTNIRDSVRYRDSIVTIVDENGNVLRTEVYKWRDRFRESSYLLNQLQTRYDSLYLAKQDSVQVPYPVEKQLSRWQSMKMELGGWAFGVIIVMALIIVGWLVYKWRKKCV